MSDFGKTLQQLSSQAKLVWLAHPYPASGELYDFLAQKDSLAAIKKVSSSLYLGADKGYNWVYSDFADKRITPEALPQAIADWQAKERAASTLGHMDAISPASLAKLMINARDAEIELKFIGESKLYELDANHMKSWQDSANSDRSMLGSLAARLTPSGRLENSLIAEAIENPQSYLGKVVMDKLHGINRAQLYSAAEVVADSEGGRAVVVYPSETVHAVHNFDLSMQMAAQAATARRAQEDVTFFGPEDLAKWEERAKASPDRALILRFDIKPSQPVNSPQSELINQLPQDKAAAGAVSPAFSLASGQVTLPEWDKGSEILPETVKLAALAKPLNRLE